MTPGRVGGSPADSTPGRVAGSAVLWTPGRVSASSTLSESVDAGPPGRVDGARSVPVAFVVGACGSVIGALLVGKMPIEAASSGAEPTRGAGACVVTPSS